MSTNHILKLVEALLECPSLKDRNSSSSILNLLPAKISNAIPHGSTNQDQVTKIVETCSKYPNGLTELVAAIRVFDEGTIPLQHVEELIKELPLPCSSQPKGEKKLSTSNREVPPLLPYSANRLDHRLKLAEAIEKHHNKQRPLLCLIHGEECQRGDKFIDVVEEFLRVTEKPLHILTDIFKNINDLHKNTRAGLSDRLLGKMNASDDEIVNAIAQRSSAGPVIFGAVMDTEDWLRAGKVEIFKGFANFWANLPPLPPTSNNLVLVCLLFQYESETMKKNRFFKRFPFFKDKQSVNEEIKATFANLEFTSGEVNGVVLPELCSIHKKQVVEWVNCHVEKYFHDEVMPEIHKLFECHQTITMAQLGNSLKEILRQCCYQ